MFHIGSNALRHCEARVDGILLVTDDEICGAVTELYRHGLVVEPSGAAGYAALAFGKVPEVKGKKIVIVITGGNVTPEELQQIMWTTVEHSHCSLLNLGDQGYKPL